MRHRCHVPYAGYTYPCGLKSPDGGLPTRAWAFDEYVHPSKSMLHTSPGGHLTGALSSKRSSLTRTLKSGDTGTAGGDNVTFRVCKRNERIVECRPDVSLPPGDRLTLSPSRPCSFSCHLLVPLLLSSRSASPGDSLTSAPFGARIRLGPLPTHGQTTAVA